MELTCDGLAVGGAGIGRDPEGRVVFVTGAIPGERVVVEGTQDRKDFSRARVRAVLIAAPERVPPPCPYVAQGCGGCDWQHIDSAEQPAFKRSIVIDALRRIGKLEDAASRVRVGDALPAWGHRTTVRAAVRNGRAAFRMAASHESIAVDRCLVAHPAIDSLLRDVRFGAADEVTIRVSQATGAVLMVVAPNAREVTLPPGLPADVGRRITVVGLDEVRAGSPAALHETVAGRSMRVSASSFFQTQHAGAEALVDAVDRSVGEADVLFDLYGGVGLFAATVGRRFSAVISVERHGSSSNDASFNLRGRPGAAAVAADVDAWRPDPQHLAAGSRVVVADPSRAGLGRRGVATVAACEAQRVVLVSCDAGSLGRDAALLAAAGYELVEATLVDLFPQTSHVEVVSRFDRRANLGGAPA